MASDIKTIIAHYRPIGDDPKGRPAGFIRRRHTEGADAGTIAAELTAASAVEWSRTDVARVIRFASW